MANENVKPRDGWVDPEVIYLQPWCSACNAASYEDRFWAPDDPWGKCEECGSIRTFKAASGKLGGGPHELERREREVDEEF